MRITRASRNERQNYGSRNTLFGYVRIKGTVCPIEFNNADNSQYVIVAPDGVHFMPDGVSRLLCTSLNNLTVQANNAVLEKAA